jgi:intracellular septation protein A
MKLLSKIFNNPLSLIVVLASVWYLTRDFIYFTLAIFSFITIQVALEKLTLGKVSKVLFFSWCVLIPFALMTLVLRDPIFLQWKFSIVHWLMGLILIIAHYFKGPALLKGLFFFGRTSARNCPSECLVKCYLFCQFLPYFRRFYQSLLHLLFRFRYLG